jgi:excisionase family DNA binding protein
MQTERTTSESPNGIAVRDGLLTIRQAAQYLAVSDSTLYGWVWQRRIPFVKIGRAVRFDLQDLAAFIEANKQLPRKEPVYSSRRANPCYNTRAAGKG